jgi:hypothetical protein
MQIRAHRLHRNALAPRLASPPDGQQSGWEVACPRTFEITWNGGSAPDDLDIRMVGGQDDELPCVESVHGHGVLTFHVGCQIKTTEPYALWLGAPPGPPKDGIAPLERLLDTAPMPCALVVHWQVTRPGQTIRFTEGEPIARLRVHPRPGVATLEVERVEAVDTALARDVERDLVKMANSDLVGSVLARLRSEPAPSTAAGPSPATPRRAPLPFGCFDTIDGVLDLRSFEPDFFFPERFRGVFVDALRTHGQVQLRDFYVVDERRLVFMSVPKVACTAIKLALIKARGIKIPADKSLHQYVHIHPSWHREAGRLGEAQTGYHRFAFVRNPFDRLVSCYRSKIVFEPTPSQPHHLYAGYYFDLPTNVPFDDFARRVAKIPDALADAHFKSQHALLYDGGELVVDDVGRFERIEADWQPLAARHGLEPTLEASNESTRKDGVHDDYRHYYTEELATLVYERYRKDVHTFGYEAEYADLLDFVRTR